MSDPIDDPEQGDCFGRKLNDLAPAELLRNAHWAHRLIDAMWDGEFDCPSCGRQTNNGICTGCRRGTSEFVVNRKRAEFAESLLCAMALEHGLDRMGTYDLSEEELTRQRADPRWDGWVWAPCSVGECVFCDAARGG